MKKNEKIEKYHFEEIIFILLILTSELSKYDEEDLMSFSESIEGRVEVLFTKNFLSTLNKSFGITPNIISDLEKLKKSVIKLYEPQWIKKLLGINQEIAAIRLSASQILDSLKINKTDPKKFSEKHLNINW